MAVTPVIPCKGLHTSDSPLSALPIGASVVAENCVCQFGDVVEPRRGQTFIQYQVAQDFFDATFGSGSSRSNEGTYYGSSLIQHYGTDKLTRYVAGVGYTDYSGSYTPPDATLLRMKFLEAVGNLYFTTNAGVYVLDSASGTPARAGVPRCISLKHQAGLNDSSGWLDDNSQVGARAVWGIRDANDNVKLGAPSQRVVTTNAALQIPAGGMVRAGTTVTVTFTAGTGTYVLSGGTVDIQPTGAADANFPAGVKTVTGKTTTTFTYTEAGAAVASTQDYEVLTGPRNVLWSIGIPSGVGSSHFVRVYRSLGSSGRLVAPDEDYFQSYEGKIPANQTVAIGAMAKVASTICTVTLASHGYQEGQRLTFSPGEANFPAGEKEIFNVTTNTFQFIDTVSATATNTAQQTVSVTTNLVVKDTQPEDFLGAPLYTSVNEGDGPESANFQPPIAKDICEWQGRTWYINTTDKHRFYLTLLGVGSPDGVQNGDTVTINSVAYTARTTLTGTPPEFLIKTDGTPAQNLETTAINLCDAINRYANAGVYAYYDEAENEIPGRITLEERSIGGSAFAVYGSRPASWHPVLPTSSSGAPTSKNDRRKNGISYSKRGEPEAVPLGNFEFVGSGNHELLRGIPLRDKLILFANNNRIYTVSGSYPFRVDELDGTTLLLNPDSAVVHNNAIIAFTSQGVVQVSDAGVRILSKEIESELLGHLGAARSSVKRYGFGVSYESDRQYHLWIPTVANRTYCDVGYVYNSATGTWTKWVANRTWGRVDPSTDKLYMGDGATNKTRVERKQYLRSDYADEVLIKDFVSGNGTTSIVLDSVSGISVGDMLQDNEASSSTALITAVNAGTNTLTVHTAFSYTGLNPSQAYVYKRISCRFKWAPAVPSGPNFDNHFQNAHLHFGKLITHTVTVEVDTEHATTAAEVALTQDEYVSTDAAVYNNEPTTSPKNRRADIPPNYGEATQVRVAVHIQEAWALWSLHGYSLEYERAGQRTDY